MNTTFEQLLQQLRRATGPEEIFGALSGDPYTALKRRYRELMHVVHPDRNPGMPGTANEAAQMLQEWYVAAQRQLDLGSYGMAPSIVAVTKLHHYIGYSVPLHGDLCDLFPARTDGDRVFLKTVRHARNNDLLQSEARVVRRLDQAFDGQPVRAHFPTLVESFLLRDAAGAERQTNVLQSEDDYVSLAEVLRAYPQGIHPADAAWMFNRLLTALGLVHGLGIVHGAVLPPHLLLRLSDHNGMLIDWCYSVPQGDALKAISPAYAADYPPEVRAKEPATSATDVYMAARCMLRLVGGDMQTCDVPPRVPKAIRALLRACLIPSPQRRFQDAWQVFDEFQQILRQCYGPPQFRPFQMPPTAS